MNAKKFRLIHGLPGAGKTTVCRAIASKREDICFADLGRSPDFGHAPMHKICAELFLQQSNADYLLTEACLPKKSARDAFVQNVVSYIEEKSDIRFDDVEIIYLEETPERLSNRRNRSAEAYSEMEADIQTGSAAFSYFRYDGSIDSVDERADRIMKHLG